MANTFEEMKNEVVKAVNAFSQVADNLKTQIKAQADDIQRIGGTSSQVSAAITRHEESMKQIQEEVAGFKTGIEEKMKELERPGVQSAPSAITPYKSLGQRFIESNVPADFVKRGSVDSKFKFNAWLGQKDGMGRHAVKFFEEEAGFKEHDMGTKDVTDYLVAPRTTYAGGEPLSVPVPFATIDVLREPLRIEQLMNVVSTTNDTVYYIEQVLGDPLMTMVDTNSTIAAGATSIPVDSIAGFYPQQTIDIVTSDGAERKVVTAVTPTGGEAPKGTITIASALAGTVDDRNRVTSRTFGGQKLGQHKPYGALRDPALKSTSIKTYPHLMAVAKQSLEDYPTLRNRIDTNLLADLDRNREEQILHGIGDDENILGILNHPQRQTYAQSAVAGDTKIDALRRPITLTRASYLPATGMVVNLFDWEEIELLKDSENRYLWVVVTEGGIERMWQVPVVVAQTLQQGRALIGNFRQGATLHVRSGATLEVSTSNRDWFERNIIAIRAEERYGLSIERPQAFVDISFTL